MVGSVLMMSLRSVHAGYGYQYLLRSVATNDAHTRGSSEKLSDYYQAKGTPPGRWLGGGLDCLASPHVMDGKVVEADQMLCLYGVGLHPDAHQFWAEGGSYSDALLGRAYRTFTNNIDVLTALRDAEKAFRVANNRLPSEEERSDLVVDVARPFYQEATGFDHASGKDIVAWVNAQQRQVRQAVAGYDLTFSPVKSVSVLWALADEDTANTIASLHHKAVAEALAWAEDNVIFTRRGNGGIEQAKTRGIIAAEFTHFDTRLGDPDLHSHVLVSNKVQAEDGSWLAIDGAELFRNAQSISARYDAVLMEMLTRELGLDFVASSRGDDVAPVWEVKGVPEAFNGLFSSRKAQARPVFDQLVEDYRIAHGHGPDRLTRKKLWQEAILETRDEKKPAQSLSEMRLQWRDKALTIEDGHELLRRTRFLTRGLRGNEDERPVFGAESVAEDVDMVAARALEVVTSQRSVFLRHHVATAVATQLKGWRFSSPEDLNRALDACVDKALSEHAVLITPNELLSLPQALRRQGERGLDRKAGSDRFTTRAILEAERTVLAAADEPVAVFGSAAKVRAAVAEHERSNGWVLNEGQAALAESLVTSGALVGCGVGPAGTGKTTSMQIVRQVWEDDPSGRKVIGLAPSAQAARVLGDEIGAQATTIDALTFTWLGGHPHRPAHDVSALPIEINPGDMLLVDEAGMASTDKLAALVDIAREAGAVVRLIGDPYQLSAVGATSVFGALTKHTGAVELTDVMRFNAGKDTDQAEASLKLRRGDATGVDLYDERGWIVGGGRAAMLADAVADYIADVAAGRRSLVIAPTNADVDQINQMIRTHRIDTGEVDTTYEVTVARGDVVGVGDTVIARKNAAFFDDSSHRSAVIGKVVNGQLFTVTAILSDGGLEVADVKTKARQVIPAEYAAEYVHLGYGATVHRAQGVTVDVCRAVIDSSTDRAAAYVALSRGKKENRAYCVTDSYFDVDAEEGHFHMSGNHADPSAVEVLQRAVARDRRRESAVEACVEEVREATSRQRIEQLYRHGVELATTVVADEATERLVDQLAGVAARRFSADPRGRARIHAQMVQLSLSGVDPRTVPAHVVDGVDNAADVAAVMCRRLSDYMPEQPVDVPYPPAWSADADQELLSWLEQTFDNLCNQEEVSLPEFEAGVQIIDEVFDRANAHGRVLTDVTFTDCDFKDADFTDADLQGVNFSGCCLDGADFSGARLSKTTFKDCSMKAAKFVSATLSAASKAATVAFSRCRMIAADLREAIIINASFNRCDLTQACFDRSEINYGYFWDNNVSDVTSENTHTRRITARGNLGDSTCFINACNEEPTRVTASTTSGWEEANVKETDAHWIVPERTGFDR